MTKTKRHLTEVHKRRISNSMKKRDGGYVRQNGRYYCLFPGHPRANKRGYVPRYVVLMEVLKKRFLTDDEVVYHVNGNLSDDRRENLRLFPNKSELAKFY